MKKRGQVTLFVLLGILILLVIIILIFLLRTRVDNASGVNENIDVSQTKLEVDNIVQSCLDDHSERAIWEAGEHGGYALQHNYLYFCDGVFPVTEYIKIDNVGREWLDEYTYFNIPGSSIGGSIPLNQIKQDSEKCLEGFIRERIANCFIDFSQITKKGWETIEVSGDCSECDYKNDVGLFEEYIGINVDLSDNVFIDIDVPKEFNRDDSAFQIGSYSTSINFNFDNLFEQVDMAVDNCDSLDPNRFENIKLNIENNAPSGYEVMGFPRFKGDVNGREAYQYIITNGEFRFKFGVAC